MKIQSRKTKLIAPVLLLIPMASMHLGDGHHADHQHFSLRQSSIQHFAHDLSGGGMMGQRWITIHQDSPEQR